MGSRGRNRKGLYVALLYLLELQYESERRQKGDAPGLWRPSPRNRPNHFCFWVLDALETVNGPNLQSVGGLLRALDDYGLPNVGQMLAYTLARKFTGSRLEVMPLEQILDDLGSTGGDGERHPQARKFARVVSEHLDGRWREAIEAIAEEFEEVGGLPRMAFLLGALPPSLSVLSGRIFSALDDSDMVAEHEMLTVVQFYGLVTGTLPPAPASWEVTIDKLSRLSVDELELLAGLSSQQRNELRRLGVAGYRLVQLRNRLHLSPANWAQVGNHLAGRDDEARWISGPADRVAAMLAGGELPAWESVRELVRSDAWRRAGEIDAELQRLIERREVSMELVARIEGWTQSTWSDIEHLLTRHLDWVRAYLEDCDSLRQLFATRSGAQLGLRDLFPQTFAWLDEYLTDNLEDALIRDVGDLQVVASQISRRVQERLWFFGEGIGPVHREHPRATASYSGRVAGAEVE